MYLTFCFSINFKNLLPQSESTRGNVNLEELLSKYLRYIFLGSSGT